MPAENRSVRDALAPEFTAVLGATSPIGMNTGAELHSRIVKAFASACGISFECLRALGDDKSQWMQFDASFGVHPNEADLRVILSPGRLESTDEQGLAILLAYFYLPDAAKGAGAATELLKVLGVLWARMGAREIHASATGEGSCALARWGFTLRSFGLGGGRVRARNGLAARANPASGRVAVPAPLAAQLRELLNAPPAEGPLVNMRAVLDLAVANDPYGHRLLLDFEWPAWRSVDQGWEAGRALGTWLQ